MPAAAFEGGEVIHLGAWRREDEHGDVAPTRSLGVIALEQHQAEKAARVDAHSAIARSGDGKVPA